MSYATPCLPGEGDPWGSALHQSASLPCDTVSLLVEPDAGQILVDVVARRDLPALEVRAMGDDAVPPQRDEVVRLLVEHPLFVGAHDPLLLGDVAGAVHGVVQLLELLVLEAAVLVTRHVRR